MRAGGCDSDAPGASGPVLGAARGDLPADGSFTDARPLIAIETRGRYLRHSVTILCVSAEGRLYVMARHAPTKRWVRDLDRDPRVRLRIGSELYGGRAVRLAGGPEGEEVARAFLRKYVGIDAAEARPLVGLPARGDDRAEVWTWRIDAPEPDA